VEATSPKTVLGNSVQFMAWLNVTSPTGTGMTQLDFTVPAPELSFSTQIINTGYPSGIVSLSLSLDTTDAEQFKAGVYGLRVTACQGKCYSSHPHSIVFGSVETHFELTD